MPAARVRMLGAFAVASSAIVLAAAVHAWVLSRPLGALGWDEGYMGAFAVRMLDGRMLPYVDAVSHRGPVLYWLVAAAQALGGRFSWAGIRWLALALSEATVLGCVAAGFAARAPIAGATAGLVSIVVTLVAMDPSEGIALNGEQAATPIVLAALAVTALAMRRETDRRARGALLAVAGVAVGVATMTKQTSLVALVPLGLWAAADAHARGDERPSRGPLLVAAGFSLPVVAILARYAAAGALGTFAYWFYGYNARVYMAPYAGVSREAAIGAWAMREPIAALALALVLVASVARIATRVRSFDRTSLAKAYAARGFEATVAIGAAVALAAAVAPLRFYEHYFVPVAPWVGLLVGLGAERAVRGGTRKGAALAQAIFTGGLVVVAALAARARVRALDDDERRGTMAPTLAPICAAIDARSEPGDSIFVWGFDGDVYVTCARRPASRFVATTMVAGVVPPFGGRRSLAWIADGAPALAAADLRASRPALVVDMPDRIGVSVREVPELAAILDDDYDAIGSVFGGAGRRATLYARRDAARRP